MSNKKKKHFWKKYENLFYKIETKLMILENVKKVYKTIKSENALKTKYEKVFIFF